MGTSRKISLANLVSEPLRWDWNRKYGPVNKDCLLKDMI
jgi:hypothetical protein